MLIPIFSEVVMEDQIGLVELSDDGGFGWRITDTTMPEIAVSPKFGRKMDCEALINALEKRNISSMKEIEELFDEEYAEIIANSLFW